VSVAEKKSPPEGCGQRGTVKNQGEQNQQNVRIEPGTSAPPRSINHAASHGAWRPRATRRNQSVNLRLFGLDNVSAEGSVLREVLDESVRITHMLLVLSRRGGS
jgi:hypothetical protein